MVPGSEKIVVSLGDSYISGEAGRWAGNSSGRNWASFSDALGATAYGDNNGVEALPQCHRSRSAEINFGGTVTSVNLACSGATTGTDASEKPFKPGVDFTDTTVGANKAVAYGQALLLKNLALSNPGRVKMVVLSIGGNDFKFGGIVKTCLTNFLSWDDYCKDEEAVQSNFTQANIDVQRAAIAGAMANVVKAMKDAGYKARDWNLVVQTYPSPIASSQTILYWQTLLRQSLGGCGLYNADLDWANGTALPTINQTVREAAAVVRGSADAPNLQVMDLTNALMGHRLCERGTTIVGKLPPWGNWTPVKNWKQSNAADLSEWVNQIRVSSQIDPEGNKPYELQESLHPNYWAQKAYQSCLAQVYGDGTRVRGGDCVLAGAGLDQAGRPKMRLDPVDGWDDGMTMPPRVITGAKGPGSARKLMAKADADGVVTASWRKPAKKSSVRVYLYRTRRGDQQWSGWINVGQSTSANAVLSNPGKYRIQVLAANENGSGKAVRAGFRVRG